jgi:hypothetical protein
LQKKCTKVNRRRAVSDTNCSKISLGFSRWREIPKAGEMVKGGLLFVEKCANMHHFGVRKTTDEVFI